jgi:hypothetical protein
MSGLPDEFVPDEPVRIGTPDPTEFDVPMFGRLNSCRIGDCCYLPEHVVADEQRQLRIASCAVHIDRYRDADRYTVLGVIDP